MDNKSLSKTEAPKSLIELDFLILKKLGGTKKAIRTMHLIAALRKEKFKREKIT